MKNEEPVFLRKNEKYAREIKTSLTYSHHLLDNSTLKKAYTRNEVDSEKEMIQAVLTVIVIYEHGNSAPSQIHHFQPLPLKRKNDFIIARINQ